MNYKKHYDTLILRAKSRVIEGYIEKHHIIPQCLGGTNDVSNLVILTPEEHYVAHQLLCKIYPDNSKLLYAARMMTVGGKNHSRNNKCYGWLKRKKLPQGNRKKPIFTKPRKTRAKETKPRSKRILSEDHRQKIGASRKGYTHTNETKERIRQSNIITKSHQNLSGINSHMYGKTHSEETKRKISETKRKRSTVIKERLDLAYQELLVRQTLSYTD